MTEPKKKRAHYVNNQEFLEALIQYKKDCYDAENSGEDKPVIPNYIGECLLKIATHLSYKPNFINYSYRDDMILDGVENCILYLSNFNPEKSKNPFSYFTQIIYYAFLRRIMKERKQSYVKNKMIQELPMEVFDQLEGDDAFYSNQYIDFRRSTQNFDDYIERRKQKKLEDRLKRSMGLDELAIDDGDSTDEDSDNN